MSDDNNKVTLTIDGQQVSVTRGTTVLAAAKSIGIDILLASQTQTGRGLPNLLR